VMVLLVALAVAVIAAPNDVPGLGPGSMASGSGGSGGSMTMH
jgi:hypothetical protein